MPDTCRSNMMETVFKQRKLITVDTESVNSISSPQNVRWRLCMMGTISLYRHVWIAPIAWSRTSLDTQTAVMFVCFQRVRVRCNANYVPYAQMPACRVGLTDLYNWIACGVCSIIVWFADNVPPSLCSTSACAVQIRLFQSYSGGRVTCNGGTAMQCACGR